MPTKNQKNTTLDNLAMMIAKGFGATTNDISQLSTEVKEVKEEVGEIKETMYRIEKIILADHRERIIRLEDQVKELQSDYSIIQVYSHVPIR